MRREWSTRVYVQYESSPRAPPLSCSTRSPRRFLGPHLFSVPRHTPSTPATINRSCASYVDKQPGSTSYSPWSWPSPPWGPFSWLSVLSSSVGPAVGHTVPRVGVVIEDGDVREGGHPAQGTDWEKGKREGRERERRRSCEGYVGTVGDRTATPVGRPMRMGRVCVSLGGQLDRTRR